MIKRYWPRYKRRARLLTIAMQVILTLFVGIALIIAGMSPTAPAFWVVLIAVCATALSLNVILVTQLLIPLQDLAAALAHVSGEPTDVIPPNPNAKHFEHDGFKPLLQYIYESAAEGGKPSDSAAPPEFASVQAALDETSAGIIVLSAQGTVTYANKHLSLIHI